MNKLKRLLHKYNQKYSDPTINPQCKEFEVDNWIISDFVVNELVPVVGVRPYPINELLLMVASVCRLKPTHIFEWGTHHGKSARIFYEISRKFEIKMEIHSIDLPDDIDHVEHPGNKRGLYVKGIEEVKLYQGDGLSKSLEICKNKSIELKPLFFLDGDHSYNTVKHELDTIITNIPNASILLHDTFFQSPESGYNVGPHNAIEDVLAAKSKKFLRISTNTGLPGMTLLYNL